MPYNEREVNRQVRSQLVNSDRSITEIAGSLHFCDSSAFSKAFKRWTGKSPWEFRGSHPSLVNLF